jgi:predicted RNase H-like HicB family nuclease
MNGNTFPHLTFTIQIFREEKLFVAYNPELDVSSCGSTLEKAKINIKDAIGGFLKSATKMGTLREILEEAGYVYRRTHWVDPELVSLDRMSVSM